MRGNKSFIETVTSCLGLLDVLNPWHDETATEFDTLSQYAQQEGSDLLEAAERRGQQPNPKILAISLALLIRDWFDSGAQQVIYLKDQLYLRGWGEGTEDQRFIFAVVSILEPLAQIELEHEFDQQELLKDVVENIRVAVAFAEQRNRAAAALDALDAVSRLCLGARLPVHIKLAAEALRIARLVGDADRSATQALRYATALLTDAQEGRASWLEALNAFEEVLRNLPNGEEAFKTCVGGVVAAARLDQMHALRPWLSLIVADPHPEVKDLVGGLSGYLPLVFAGDLKTFQADLNRLVKVVQLSEDERLRSQPASTDRAAEADWATWSYRHSAFRNAIPHGNSFMRERDVHQLALVLNHELTHLLSMSSGVGMAIIALRAALVNLEILLWAGAAPDTQAAIAGLLSGIAPVTTEDFSVLATIERTLELTLKLRVLQDCWAPWFEGIAIAEELSDPRDDRDAHTPSLQVLIGLVDAPVKPDPDTDQQTFQAKVLGYFSEFEQLYGAAVEELGLPRLRAYLTPPQSRNYLAGFLTVRSIVAAWRSTLREPLTGPVAVRILMHLTRWGTHDVVPDLALPLDEFRQKAIEQHLDWVTWLPRLTADQLKETKQLISGDPETPGELAQWRNRTLVKRRADDQDLLPELNTQMLNLTKQAFASLTGQYAPPNRVAGANGECLTILEAVAKALVQQRPEPELVTKFAQYYFSLLAVVPLGSVDAPFWLLPAASGFCVLIRTTEKHHKHGEPSYNGMVIYGLKQDDFEQLHAEVRRLQQPRMTVTRFGDLLPGGFRAGRGFGVNVLTFQYGEWIYMEPCGLLLGASDIDESLRGTIEDRLRTWPIAKLDMMYLADGAASARRARTWLDGIEKWEFGGHPVPLEPWANRVRALADEIEHPTERDERSKVGAALLRFILGTNIPAEAIVEDGLRGLRVGDKGSIGNACRLLLALGKGPRDTNQVADEVQQWPSLFRVTESGVDFAVPPHMAV